MASDVDEVFLDAEDFGLTALIRAGGRGDGVTIKVMDSEWQDSLSGEVGGYAGRAKECSFFAALSACVAALGRHPQAGDTLEPDATGPRAGTWNIVEVVPDSGDGCTMLCRQKEIISTRRGGEGGAG
jgi:hypothetical protein